jgi:cardiolipin synthase
MSKPAYYLVNGITFYRVIAAFIMLFLLYDQQFGLFKWLLVISFFTDAVDGYLARTLKVISKFGSSLDSIADDLTVAVAIIGIIVYEPDFLMDQIFLIVILSSLYMLQIVLALIRYGKISSFHTYAAKIAAISQGIFLILFFFLPQPLFILFYLTAVITILDLAEEIILVIILPQWETNVKGLYWVIKKENIPGKQ